MADKTVDWFAETNRYAVSLMEQGLKAAEATAEHRPQKIVANGPILADLVEVVRCKDCIYYKQSVKRCDHPSQDCDECYDCWLEMKPDDFCSYGERRTDG